MLPLSLNATATAAIEHHIYCPLSTGATAVIHHHRQTPTATFVHRRCQTLTPNVATHHRWCQLPSLP
jgi:hypothetical protein